MFGIDSSEFLLVAIVALVVIGPKDLPKAMRVVGYWVGRARGIARQFRSGFDEMVREAELAEMEKKWKAENERIMREHATGGMAEASVLHDPAAAENGVTSAIPVDGDIPLHDQPVMVEKPQVVAAPPGTPTPRGDGVTS